MLMINMAYNFFRFLKLLAPCNMKIQLFFTKCGCNSLVLIGDLVNAGEHILVLGFTLVQLLHLQKVYLLEVINVETEILELISL